MLSLIMPNDYAMPCHAVQITIKGNLNIKYYSTTFPSVWSAPNKACLLQTNHGHEVSAHTGWK